PLRLLEEVGDLVLELADVDLWLFGHSGIFLTLLPGRCLVCRRAGEAYATLGIGRGQQLAGGRQGGIGRRAGVRPDGRIVAPQRDSRVRRRFGGGLRQRGRRGLSCGGRGD